MLLRKDTLEGIARGEIDVAFRWWTKPTVKAGGFLQTAVGRLAIVSLEPSHDQQRRCESRQPHQSRTFTLV